MAYNDQPIVQGVYNSTAPTPSAGTSVPVQTDSSGNLKVDVTNGVSSGTAGSPSANVVTVQGITGAIPIDTAIGLTTTGGASYSNAIAPATPAVHVVKSSAGNVYGIRAFNLLATPVFLKMFDVSGTITLGTTSATYQFMIPGSTGGAGFVISIPELRSHANSINYAVTNAISLADDTSITANSVIVDVSYN